MTEDKITGVGAEAEALAAKLTRYPDSDIFKHDDKKYYAHPETKFTAVENGQPKTKTYGEMVKNYDGIKEGKLKEALVAEKAAESLGKKTSVSLSKEVQQALDKGKELLATAKVSLDKKITPVPKEAKIPLARLVEAANQYYAVGDKDNGNTLLNYAIQQAELIEKPKLKSPGEQGPITEQLKEYKAAVDEHYKDAEKEKVKSPGYDKNSQNSALDYGAMIAEAKVELSRNTLAAAKPIDQNTSRSA